MHRFSSSFLVSVLLALAASGCASAPDTADDEQAAGGTESDLRSCSVPQRYFVASPFSECTPIPGKRGTWVPGSLFEDAPDVVQSTMCLYTWKPTRSARPDAEALRGAVGWKGGAAAACGADSVPKIGALEEIPKLRSIVFGGAVGCDVCTVIHKGSGWIVLPPSKVITGEFAVKRTDGKQSFFHVAGVKSGDEVPGRALSFTLPPPPEGTAYIDGPVQIY